MLLKGWGAIRGLRLDVVVCGFVVVFVENIEN